MTYNPAILQDLLKTRSLNRNSLSTKLGLERSELDRELSREPQPKQSLLNEIARELALPVFVFYMTKVPDVQDVIPDFRHSTPVATPKSRQTIESIQLAKAIQRTCAENDVPPVERLPRFNANVQVEDFAFKVREFFGISWGDQAGAKSARDFYVVCRKKIEDRGIFVIHEQFPAEDGSGFCLADSKYPVIVINTQQQTRGRRLFTLVHELAHVLLHETGISDPFDRKNAIEKLCNAFAVGFLTPADYVDSLLKNFELSSQPDLDEIRRAANRLKISQQATVLRLEQLGFYRKSTHDNWLLLIHNTGNPDFTEKGGGAGGPPPQEKVKLAKYGFHFSKAFSPLLEKGLLSEINLYRATGLKPKYQRDYFNFANSLLANGLGEAELGDE